MERSIKIFDCFEEDWEEYDNISVIDIYNVIYGSLKIFNLDILLNYRVIKKNKKVTVLKRNENIDNDDIFICYFDIMDDKIFYSSIPDNIIKYYYLKNDRWEDKFQIHMIFKKILNNHLENE